MTEFNDQVFDWIDQAADAAEREQRIKTIHATIGQVLLAKYQDLSQEVEIARNALTDIGLFNQQEPLEGPHITALRYDQICEEVGVAKGLGSRLWQAMRRQAITGRWPNLFDDQDKLNIKKLDILVASKQLYGPRLGDKSRRAAGLIVEHIMEVQDKDL